MTSFWWNLIATHTCLSPYTAIHTNHTHTPYAQTKHTDTIRTNQTHKPNTQIEHTNQTQYPNQSSYKKRKKKPQHTAPWSNSRTCRNIHTARICMDAVHHASEDPCAFSCSFATSVCLWHHRVLADSLLRCALPSLTLPPQQRLHPHSSILPRQHSIPLSRRPTKWRFQSRKRHLERSLTLKHGRKEQEDWRTMIVSCWRTYMEEHRPSSNLASENRPSLPVTSEFPVMQELTRMPCGSVSPAMQCILIIAFTWQILARQALGERPTTQGFPSPSWTINSQLSSWNRMPLMCTWSMDGCVLLAWWLAFYMPPVVALPLSIPSFWITIAKRPPSCTRLLMMGAETATKQQIICWTLPTTRVIICVPIDESRPQQMMICSSCGRNTRRSGLDTYFINYYIYIYINEYFCFYFRLYSECFLVDMRAWSTNLIHIRGLSIVLITGTSSSSLHFKKERLRRRDNNVSMKFNKTGASASMNSPRFLLSNEWSNSNMGESHHAWVEN